MTTTAPRRESSIRKGWRVPAGLIMLGFIPVLAGAFRLTQLGSGAEITPDNERFFASPGPVVVHIVTVSVYAILGAFQFAPRFRARRRGWHETHSPWRHDESDQPGPVRLPRCVGTQGG